MRGTDRLNNKVTGPWVSSPHERGIVYETMGNAQIVPIRHFGLQQGVMVASRPQLGFPA